MLDLGLQIFHDAQRRMFKIDRPIRIPTLLYRRQGQQSEEQKQRDPKIGGIKPIKR